MAGMNNLGPSQAFDFYAHGVASGQQGLYTPFLGPPPREEKMNAYRQRSTAKWNMPDAYVGQNEVLRDTMEDYMLTAQWDWYTERILPWYKTDDIHLQWNEWENNPHYLGITPHQTASRVVTQKRTVRKASIIRRGIAAEFEHDFVSTALGRSSFMASLAQMARSVQETANVEVIRALLHCHRHQQIYMRKYGIVRDFELDEYHERRANRFMVAQKDEFGMEKLSVEIETEQEMYGARADVWILDRSVFNYTTTVPEGKIFYFKGGQEAVDRINGRRKGAPAAAGTMGNVRSLEPERMVANTPVFIAKSFHVENLGKADLMSRVTEIGVYNKMIDRCNDYTRYTTASRDIRVYDNDIDSWSDIKFMDALYNAPFWNKDGSLRDVYSKGGRRTQVMASNDDYDFLSFKNGDTRIPIKYVGEMDQSYQSAQDLLDVGQSMVGALAYGDAQEARAILKNNTDEITIDLVKKVKSLLPANNLLADSLATDATITTFVSQFNLIDRATIVPIQSHIGASVSGSETLSSMETRFLGDIMGAALPSKYSSKVAEIAANTQVDWKKRASTIKGLVLEALEADPSSVPSLRNVTDVDAWYQKNTSRFEQKHNERASTVGDVAGQGETKTHPIGAPLPAGYQWADPNEHKYHALARFSAFHDFLESKGLLHGDTGATASRLGGRRAAIGARAGGVGGAVPESRRKEDERLSQKQSASADANRILTEPAGAVAMNFRGLAHIVDQLLASRSHPAVILLAIFYACVRFHRDDLVALARRNVAIKLGLLLMRPHCTYRTKFGIKCLSGGGSGYTFFGHSNMQIEHEAARKVGMMHYTTYLSCVVLYPKNVYVVEDLYCDKYLGGMGVEFWNPDVYRSGNVKRNTYSIICAPLPPSRKNVEQKIDIRGRWYTEQRLNLVSQDRFDVPLYESCGLINRLFGTYDATRRDRNVSRSRVPANFVCWQGMEWYYNDKVGRFDDYTVESGSMGPKVYPGCGLVRNGRLKLLENPNYHATK